MATGERQEVVHLTRSITLPPVARGSSSKAKISPSPGSWETSRCHNASQRAAAKVGTATNIRTEIRRITTLFRRSWVSLAWNCHLGRPSAAHTYRAWDKPARTALTLHEPILKCPEGAVPATRSRLQPMAQRRHAWPVDDRDNDSLLYDQIIHLNIQRRALDRV